MTNTQINATEDELRAVTEALKLAALLDTRAPHPEPARIAAWAEQIHRHRFTHNDLLDSIQAFYDQPSRQPIGIGDLIHHARIIKRDRLERESDEERARRRADVDTKAADLFDGTAEILTGTPTRTTPRLQAARNALDICYGKTASTKAIQEFLAAKTEAARPRTGA